MTKPEMLELRAQVVDRVERLRRIGDYSAGAADTRENAEGMLKLIDHLLERMRA